MKKSDRDYAIAWMKARGIEPWRGITSWYWLKELFPAVTIYDAMDRVAFSSREEAENKLAQTLAKLRADIAIPKPKKRPAAKAKGKK